MWTKSIVVYLKSKQMQLLLDPLKHELSDVHTNLHSIYLKPFNSLIIETRCHANLKDIYLTERDISFIYM